MTPAQRVAAHYRMRAEVLRRGAGDPEIAARIAELNAIADAVERCAALEEMVVAYRLRKTPLERTFKKLDDTDTALAKLAKAVGVEGENNG